MSIWFHEDITINQLNELNKNSMVDHCGIEITSIGDGKLIGKMPVDHRTIQPFGILHGGANCVLAETLGSVAANMTCDPKTHHAVGLSIHTNHIKGVRNGSVFGEANIIHKGRTTQIWEINTFNDANALTSKTTLTMAIVSKLKV